MKGRCEKGGSSGLAQWSVPCCNLRYSKRIKLVYYQIHDEYNSTLCDLYSEKTYIFVDNIETIFKRIGVIKYDELDIASGYFLRHAGGHHESLHRPKRDDYCY